MTDDGKDYTEEDLDLLVEFTVTALDVLVEREYLRAVDAGHPPADPETWKLELGMQMIEAPGGTTRIRRVAQAIREQGLASGDVH